jgi:hypothetical protein
MKTLVDSILLNSIQFESSSTEVLLNCLVFEGENRYESEMILTTTSMNQLLSELIARGIELDFDSNLDTIILPDGESLYRVDLTKVIDVPVFLPLYSMPEQLRLLRA